jgi:hypothetical protein
MDTLTRQVLMTPRCAVEAAELILIIAKYLARSCPRCAGYLGIVVRKPSRNTRLEAINGALC